MRYIIPLISALLLSVSSEVSALALSKCSVTGAGVIINGDVFAVNAMWMKDGTTRGSVTLLTPYGFTFHSNNIEELRCTADGGVHADPPEAPQLARLRGTGQWDGAEGYDVIVFTEDRGEPTDLDYFEVRILKDDELIYFSGSRLESGNIQHLPNNEGHPEP